MPKLNRLDQLEKRLAALEAENQRLSQMVNEHREAQREMARLIAERWRNQNTVSAQELQTIMGQIKVKQ